MGAETGFLSSKGPKTTSGIAKTIRSKQCRLPTKQASSRETSMGARKSVLSHGNSTFQTQVRAGLEIPHEPGLLFGGLRAINGREERSHVLPFKNVLLVERNVMAVCHNPNLKSHGQPASKLSAGVCDTGRLFKIITHVLSPSGRTGNLISRKRLIQTLAHGKVTIHTTIANIIFIPDL